jgi:hypothetical protein
LLTSESQHKKLNQEEEIRQSIPPTSLSKNVLQHQVQQWEEEEGMETTIFKKKKEFNTGFSGK